MDGPAFDKSSLVIDVLEPHRIDAAAQARIQAALAAAGVVVIRNLLTADEIARLREHAAMCCEHGFHYGTGGPCVLQPIKSVATRDFHHPFVVSRDAAALATQPELLDAIETYLGEPALIHHALFQHSLPIANAVLDFHIDCGTDKRLNGMIKLPDKRLRAILYLSDVESGGLSVVLDSRAEALKTFLPLPTGELYPQDRVPKDPLRQVTINEKAGALILWDTHNLHRPEAPRTDRFVLNIWFARRDFAGRLPPNLFSLAAVPQAHRDRLYVFESERGFTLSAPARQADQRPPSLMRRFARRLRSAVSL
ncbi:MAG: hypothetical protein HY246_13020 [Proteobacteria bacterium]|nr:hypothetical protein [Pseudomonadota bacterium]